MAVTKLADGRWICYWKEGKKNRRKYFGRGPDAQVAAWECHNSLGLKKRRPPAKGRHGGPLVVKLVKDYLNARCFSENSEQCFKKRMMNIGPHFGPIRALALTDEIVDQYVAKRLQTVKATTIHRELSDLQAVLNWAVRRKPPLIPYNPIQMYSKPKRDDDVILPPTPSEIDRILEHSPRHLFRAIVISYYTGIRPGVELYGLRRHDIDLENDIILVRSAAKGGPVQRHVPIMHTEFKHVLQEWLKEDPAEYIINYLGRPVSSLKTTFKKAKKKAEITRRIRLYDFRHCFATMALKRGADLKAVSEILGHSRPDITARIYQHVDLEMHRQAVARLPALLSGRDVQPKGIANILPKKGKKKGP